jgi:foldase protein PrsA
MSERNEKDQIDNEQIENELFENEHVDNEQFENELDVQEKQELVESDPVEGDPLRNNSMSAAAAEQQPNSAKNSSAFIVPWVITAIAIVALIFVLVRNPSGGSLNETVGKMDGATFTSADLYKEMSKQMGKDQQGSMLDSLMTLKLIELESVKAGVTVTAADVQPELDKVKKNFATEEEFTAALQQAGMTLDGLNEQIGTQMKLRKIFEKQTPAKEEDLIAYYDKNKEMFATTPHQVRASHILLPTKAEADAVLAELKAGKDFATLAKAKSTDPGSKDNGGDLNFFGKGQMNAEFEAAAFALKKGEMSGVVESENGFHIIKVTDIKEAVIPPYDGIKEDVKTAFYDEKISAEGQAWMDKVKKERNYVNLLVPAVSPAPGASAPAASAPASPAAE